MKIVCLICSLFTNSYKSQEANQSIISLFKQLEIPTLTLNTSKETFLKSIFEQTFNFNIVILVHNDSEFYNLKENQILLKNFLNYDCDIGFGDNFPEGIVFEIFKRDIIPIMENIQEQNQILTTRNLIQDIINIDVNTFDLENHYAEVSLRTLRLSFFANSLQNQYTINKVKDLFSNDDLPYFLFNFNDFAKTLLNNRQILQTIPKYFQINITNKQLQNYLFSPISNENSQDIIDLNLKNFERILNKIVTFSPNSVIGFAGFGESTANKDWLKMIELTLLKNVSCLLETSGIFFEKEITEHILTLKNHHLLHIVFLIEAVEKNLYSLIRGNNFNLDQILENIEYLLLKRPKNSYVQTVKTIETFDHLPQYYQYFKKLTNNIIIAKYNHFKNNLPERRINPMQPFEKIDCWHLKRDWIIDENGNLFVCKQDINKEHLIGNCLQDNFEHLFNKSKIFFEKHLNDWNFCKNCDEYYTYNF